MSRIELTASSGMKALLKSRYPQLVVLVLMLGGYIFAVVAGLIGSPVGSANFGIVMVWIAWWALLILLAVPVLGRGWCAICPIPLPGEWLQRGAVLGPSPGINPPRRLRWPRPLRNIWLASALFLMLALFSAALLTTPRLTAMVLAGMLLAAVGLGIAFERRAFCRYVCPVGGFIGLYSQVAPLELRIKQSAVCASCVGKPCYNGSVQGYGCPWDVFPAGLQKNVNCGLCLECLRTCPHDNVAINLRPFGADLARPSARLDEAFKAFVMLGSAVTYAAVLLGPWGFLKQAAFSIGTGPWFAYAFIFLAIVCILLPGLFALCVAARSDSRTFRLRFARMSSALVPLGLMAWIAFSLSFVLANASYVAVTLSDPLGLGWNLLGTADLAWQPLLTAGIAPAQSLALAVGLVWSARVAQRAADESRLHAWRTILFCAAVTLLLLWLLI